jgi:hypothetical protein
MDVYEDFLEESFILLNLLGQGEFADVFRVKSKIGIFFLFLILNRWILLRAENRTARIYRTQGSHY